MLKPIGLLICAMSVFAAHAAEDHKKVLLTKKEYLRVKEDGTVWFVEKSEKASHFFIEVAAEALEETNISSDGAPVKTMRVGVNAKAFSYQGKYLGADFILHPGPLSKNCVWLAPVHYLYFNQFHPASQSDVNFVLIPEEAGENKVRLIKKSYLKVEADGRVVWVGRETDASAFTVEQAAAPAGFAGSSHSAFAYGSKYLYYDLTLRTEKPTKIEDQWLAPIHPVYRNHYHSGPRDKQIELIAEKVECAK